MNIQIQNQEYFLNALREGRGKPLDARPSLPRFSEGSHSQNQNTRRNSTSPFLSATPGGQPRPQIFRKSKEVKSKRLTAQTNTRVIKSPSQPREAPRLRRRRSTNQSGGAAAMLATGRKGKERLASVEKRCRATAQGFGN